MAVCPNKNLPQWKALVERVGEFEAYRDYLEYNNEIRDADVVESKIEQRAEVHGKGWVDGRYYSQNIQEIFNADQQIDVAVDASTTSTVVGLQIAKQIADKLSEQLGISYEIVTKEQAMELTKKAQTPYSVMAEQAALNHEMPPPGFFYEGKVYLIGNDLSAGTTIHEFSHPLVRAIQKDKPGLFNKIYDKLVSDNPAMAQKLAEKRPDLDPTSDLFREEMVVMALTDAALKLAKGEVLDGKTKSWVDNLMYAIKQMLRKLFGKVPVSKLDPNTTLEELAAMLVQGGQFEINVDSVSEEQVIAYNTEIKELLSEIQNVEGRTIHEFLTKANTIVESTERMLSREKYEELRAALVDQYGMTDLQTLKGDIESFKATVKSRAEGVLEGTKETLSEARAFAKTLTTMEIILEKVNKHMQEIENSKRDTIDSMQKFTYYENFVDYWAEFINEISVAMRSKNSGITVSNDSPLVQLINKVEGSVKSIKLISGRVRAEGARDGLYAELEPMGRDLADKYKDIIEKLEKMDAPQSQIDRWYKEYNGMTQAEYKTFSALRSKIRERKRLSIREDGLYKELLIKNKDGLELSPEKLEGLLSGELGDAGFLNSMLEGYLYNNDAVVGGLALYVKKGLNQVMVNAQSKFNDFADALKIPLEKIGYNPSNIGQLGEEMGFLDEVAKFDEDGKVETRKVWTLLNRFKGYRLDEARLKHDVEKVDIAFSEDQTNETRMRYIEAHQALQRFQRTYMNQRYSPEYYAAQDLLEKDDIGKEAFALRQTVIDKLRAIDSKQITDENYKELSREKELALREMRQMYSSSRLDGTDKSKKELEIVERLKEHREVSRQFYEWVERKGVFQKALDTYEQELREAKVSEEDFEQLRELWIERNTRAAVKAEYYDERNRLLRRKKEILSKLSDSQQRDIDNVWIREQILDLTAGFRDEDNQIKANELTPEVVKKIRELEKLSMEKSKTYVSKSGLTSAEHARLSELFEIQQQRELTAEEMDERSGLFNKKNELGLDEFEMQELQGINDALQELSINFASEYYLDHMDELFKGLNLEQVKDKTGLNGISRDTANEIIGDPALMDDLLSQGNEQFNKWFKANHLEFEYFDKEAGEKVKGWRRLPIWSVSRPRDAKYFEQTILKDISGKPIGKPIIGLPKLEYFKRNVKDEYRTGYNAKTGRVELEVGLYIDNKGDWLPKSAEQMDQSLPNWDKYINHDYERMRKDRPDHFEVLNILTEHHLKNQEGSSWRSKLYLDFPRFGVKGLESFQKEGKITRLMKRIKGFYQKYADDFEEGLNQQDNWNLVRADIFDDELSSVPVRGLYDLEPDDVSTNITQSMMKYMFSLEQQKELLRMSPLARSVQAVVNDPENKVKDLTKRNKWNYLNRGIITYLNKEGKEVRKMAVNNFLEREFEGKNVTGWGKDVPWLNKSSNALFKAASFQFFALNIPSAMKNAWGAKFQSMIEAASGKYFNIGDWERGNLWSYKAMADLSLPSNLYAKGHKSLTQQILEIYDPSQGRTEEKFGESMSRTLLSDVASGSWLYNFRKWVELQATFQIYGGMMQKKVTQFKGTDKETQIKMLEMWELRDGKIQLKEGIDPEEGVTYDKEGKPIMGKKFNAYKNKIHQVMNNLQGAYARFDQPEAQRYLAFRMISYLRKYFTPMVLNRLGHKGSIFKGTAQPRFNAGLGEGHMGYYVQTLKWASNLLKTGGSSLPFMQAEEKAAVIRTLTEVIGLLTVTFLMKALFGWDADDEDRFEKLRAKSGPLPMWGTGEPENEFKLMGWLENHALFLLMNVRAENEQFIPLPGLGMESYVEMLDVKSVAMGPTVNQGVNIIHDLMGMAVGSDRAYYKRDAGPYVWQQEGDAKLKTRVMKMIGLSGTSTDPAMGIKNLQSVIGRR